MFKDTQHVVISPAVKVLVRAMCNVHQVSHVTGKQELLASPSHVFHSRECFDDRSSSLLTVITSKNCLANETPKELFPVPGLIFHALGGANVQTTPGAQKYSTPKNRYGQQKHLSKQMPYSCACPSVTFRPCSAEDSQAPKKTYLFCPCLV